MNPTVESITHDIWQNARKDKFAGYDPFDGLNSRFLNLIPFARNTVFGLAWLQLNKRSPINLRPLLLIPKMRNPKGVGLFILGHLANFNRTQNPIFLEEAIELGEWLLDAQCPKNRWAHACWGYHFDWKARAFYVPKGKPNMITTIYVAKALYQLGQASQREQFQDVAIDAAHFIAKNLHVKDSEQEYFAYIPGEKAFVHNASLWGAAWMATAGSAIGSDEYCQLALKIAMTSATAQRKDGAWAYGTLSHHQFIDGFHTGYNLEALDSISRTLSADQFAPYIENGLQYYINHFFTEEGACKYYQNNPYPLDMHSVAQAILTILNLEKYETHQSLIEKITSYAIEHLYHPEKRSFYYQKNKKYRNSVNYIRWTQGWAYYSFSKLLEHQIAV